MFFLGDRGFLSDPEGERGNILNPNLTTFDELQSVACLALLGEPGVGKSWSLSADVNAYLQQSPRMPTIRLDLRRFSSEDRLYRTLFEGEAFLQWAKGDYDLHLYIDSLDECLLRIDSVAALLADEIPKYPLDRLKLRIACRTASWPPLLETALKSGYGEDLFAATELVPLRRVDVLQAATSSGITDPDSFLARVDELHITSFAIKPVTLKMLLDTFQREGDLPGNVVDLYEKGCSILCEEQNESRRAARRTGDLSPRDRIAVASRIAAATQFGNCFAVCTGTEAEGVPEEDVAVGDLVGGSEPSDNSVNVTHNAILETLGTGLFSSRGQERLGWSHQMFAEFMAARYCFVHELPIQQLRSLVFHPRRRRVIPQVREVASWIALRNNELFAEIAEFDPEVLLGSAAPSLSDEQRQVLADALLRSCDQSEVLHIRHHLELRHLAHPALAEQLNPVLLDGERSMATRYFAARIARDCAVTGLGDVLLEIALSDTETHDLRTIAAYAIADIGSEEERRRLQPLLQASREIDPNDQLRGAALNAIYPGDKYDDAMWSYLEHPRQSMFFGSYNNFLSYAVVPKLNADNLPAALRWCAAQPPEDIGPIPELEGEIFSLALEHIEKDGIADLLANTVLERARSFRPLPHGRRSSGFSEILAGDIVRRRRFLEAFLPLLNRGNAHFVVHPLPLLALDDLQWYIDRVCSAQPSSSAIVEAHLVWRLACSWEPDAMNTVWHACQRSPILAQECSPIFEPVSLDSEMVQWQRKSKADLLKERNIEVAPALEPRCEAALQLIEKGEVDAG
ncbi:MAG: NACHT domain-containing protein [Acidobacteriaceae bacterium]